MAETKPKTKKKAPGGAMGQDMGPPQPSYEQKLWDQVALNEWKALDSARWEHIRAQEACARANTFMEERKKFVGKFDEEEPKTSA